MNALSWVARILAAAALLGAAMFAAKLGIADVYAQRGTTEGLSKAVELDPGNADYHRWLGITLLAKDQNRSEKEFQEAVRLNAWDWDSRLRLAVMHESRGELERAERELVETTQFNAGFLPRWTLANFEFRHERMDEFWKWMRAAVPMSFGDRTPLFELAAATGETQLSARLGFQKDDIWLAYLWWALAKAPASEIHVAALHVANAKKPEGEPVEHAAGRLLDLGAVEEALDAWNSGVKSGAIKSAEAARGRLTNPAFLKEPVSLGLDWFVIKPNGGFAARDGERGSLRIHLNGEQCEQCAILSQRAAVTPGTEYRLKVKYRTQDLKRKSGLLWVVSSAKGEIAASKENLWGEDGATAEIAFQAPDSPGWVRIELVHRRPVGEVRAEGTLLVERADLGL